MLNKTDYSDLGGTNTNKLGLYIHIPFCAAKCNYCDFNSHIGGKTEIKEYITALCKEISAYGKFVRYNSDKKYIVDTIFFGGGTPTVLSSNDLVYILDTVKDNFELTKECEITTECNPGTIDFSDLCVLKNGGFNRISMGMQSADKDELLMLGRIHTFEDCKKTVKYAKAAGFTNISLDLMFGLPQQTNDLWKNNLTAAASLKPNHISAYSLKIEEGTPFFKNGVKAADDDLSREMYDTATEFLKSLGYERYEISNFAKIGFVSRHNLKYWNCDDYIGIGVGASSCFMGKRYSNIYDTSGYIKIINENVDYFDIHSIHSDVCVLSDFDKMSEFIYLGLRKKQGVSEQEFFNRFNIEITDVFKDEVQKNLNRGTLIKKGGQIYIPDKYLYVSSGIMSDFV